MKKKNITSGLNKVLYFRADWCQPCKMIGPVVDELKAEGLNFKKIDVDDDANKKIVEKYGIMSIPAFILIGGGVEKKRLLGIQSKQVLRDLLRD